MRLTTAIRNAQILMCSIGLATLLNASTAFAEDFYRWVDDSGVVHYGSMPPQGVNATKMKAYGKSTKTPARTTAQEDEESVDLSNLPPEEIERRRVVAAKMKEDCKNEKARLEALNKPGRIRMQQEDGSFTYLSQDEIYKEIQTTKSRIKETCQ